MSDEHLVLPHELIVEIIKFTGSSRFLIVNRQLSQFARTLLLKDPRFINPPLGISRLIAWCNDLPIVHDYIQYHFVANINTKQDSYPKCCNEASQWTTTFSGNPFGGRACHHHLSMCLLNTYFKDEEEYVLACWLKRFMWFSDNTFLRAFLDKTGQHLSPCIKFMCLTREIKSVLNYVNTGNHYLNPIRICDVLCTSEWLWQQVRDPRNMCDPEETRILWSGPMAFGYRSHWRHPCLSGQLLHILAQLRHPVIQKKMQLYWHQFCCCLQASSEMQDLVFLPITKEEEEAKRGIKKNEQSITINEEVRGNGRSSISRLFIWLNKKCPGCTTM